MKDLENNSKRRGYGKVGTAWNVIIYKFLVLEEIIMLDSRWHQLMIMVDSDMGWKCGSSSLHNRYNSG